MNSSLTRLHKQCRRYPGKVVKIHSDGTVDVKRVTVWKSRLARAIDAVFRDTTVSEIFGGQNQS